MGQVSALCVSCSRDQVSFNMNRVYDLEGRLIDFAVCIIRIAESLPKTKTGLHIEGQLIRCGTSPAANYGEAQGAESLADFVHKMRLCLKELRETRVWLLMVSRACLLQDMTDLDWTLKENEELIAIFVTSIKTSKHKG